MNTLPITQNVSLLPYNTFGMDVHAENFIAIKEAATLSQLMSDPQWQHMSKFILGGGSNILFTKDVPGLVIHINNRGIEQVAEDAQHIWLKIAAGENWHQFVLHCVTQEYAGIENLSLIPGTVGAAPMQNIGAYGVEIKDVFIELEAISLTDGSLRTFSHKECEFAYRHSIFKQQYKNQYAIMNVTLRLNKHPHFHIDYGAIQTTLELMGIDKPNIQAISDAVIKIRQEKLPDPKVIGNAGSFFKNPEIHPDKFNTIQNTHPDIPFYKTQNNLVKIPAAWLIEQCGFKGKRVGDIGVHDRQALVLVNHGSGEGAQIKALSEQIQKTVADKFGLMLEREVNIF